MFDSVVQMMASTRVTSASMALLHDMCTVRDEWPACGRPWLTCSCTNALLV